MTDKVLKQLEAWVEGNSYHEEGLCCPDFSCCNGDLLSLEVRELYLRAYKRNDVGTMWSVESMTLSKMAKSRGVDIESQLGKASSREEFLRLANSGEI